MSLKYRAVWYRILDRAATLGLTLVILGLVAVQVFDVAGMAREAYGRDAEIASSSGMVAPVLEADLGGGTESPVPQPIRASIWLAPIASLRGGLGLGWLEGMSRESWDAPRELRLRLGGGLMAPLTPSMGVDLHTGD